MHLALAVGYCAATTQLSATVPSHNSTCAATLERHLDAFTYCNLTKIMADYSPRAVLQLPKQTDRGLSEISDLFTGLFDMKPPPPTSTITMKQPPQTVCTTNATGAELCTSYIYYSMLSPKLNIPVATDTFVYDDDSTILSQTFTGPNTLSPSSGRRAVTVKEADTGVSTPYKSACAATLQRHLTAFTNCNLADIMADYDDNAVLQLPNATLRGKAEISGLFAGFFQKKPAATSTIVMKQAPETECTTKADGSPLCASYIFYNMSSPFINIPLATDTFVYDANAAILSQTFTGPNVPK